MWQDDGVTASYDGNIVARWDDIIQSDNISQGDPTDCPLLDDDAVNGEAALLFGGGYTGVNDHLQGTFGTPLTPPYHIFIVAQLDSSVYADGTADYLMYSDSSSPYVYIRTIDPTGSVPDVWAMGDEGGLLTGESNNFLTTDDWGVFVARFDKPDSELWFNGGSVGTDSSVGDTVLEGLTVGSRHDGSIAWKGYVAEIIVYGDLETYDIDQVAKYLRDRYDLECTFLNGDDMCTPPPDLGQPDLYCVGVDSLNTDDLVTGAPKLGIWNPSWGTDEGSEDPVIWFRADMGIVLYPSTNRVYNWENQGSAGSYVYNSYNPASLPLLVEDSLKGQPVVRGDGKSLRQSNNFGLDGEIDLTVFIVVDNWVSGSDNFSLLQIGRYYAMYGGSNRAIQFGRDPTLGPRVWYPGSTQGGEYYDPDAESWETPHILMWQREDTDLWADGEFYQDGFEVAQESTQNPTLGPLDLVNDDYKFRETLLFTGSYIDGPAYIDIAEILVYDAFLSTADRQQVEQYLSYRYLEIEHDLSTDDLVTGAPVLETPGLYLDLLETDDLVTGIPDLGHPKLSTPSVFIGGADKTDVFVSSERIDEYCNPGVKVTLTFTEDFEVDTWDSVVLYENGFKVFTGTVSRIESVRGENRSFMFYAKDDIRRLREFFVVDDYVSSGESVQHWISFFASQAGCGTVTYLDTGNNPNTLNGMTMGKMFAYEIIDELLLYAGIDIWCDENNNVFVGTRLDAEMTDEPVEAGDNMSSFSRSRDSEPCRNAALVYGVIGTAEAQSTESWQIDSGDVRTMVVSSIYLDSMVAAEDLARRMVDAAAPEYDIKRMILDDLESQREVGDRIEYDDGDDNSGSGHITSITARWTGDPPVKEMHISLDERCPKVGAGGLCGPDGRDVTVGTYDFGVWRCKDIWASYPHWEPMNTGLSTTVDFDGSDLGSTFSVDWFIRDPYYPSSMAFLLTSAGILQTTSLEPGYENWTPVMMNSHIGFFMGDSASNWDRWHIVKLRSTVASEGKYFIAATRRSDLFNFKQSFVGMTTERFANFSSCLPLGQPGLYAYTPLAEVCGATVPYRTCQLWGNHPNNFGYEQYATLGSWHRGHGNNAGGFAGWHRHGNGCSISGGVSVFSSNGGPEWWNCTESIDAVSGTIELQTPFSESKKKGGIPPGPCECVKRGPTSHGKFQQYNEHTGCFEYYSGGGPDGIYNIIPGLHIPYDQTHYGDGSPSKIFFHPGWIQPDGKRYPSLNQIGPIILPWDVCSTLQGSFATHPSDINKMYAFSPGYTTRFAISDNGGVSWEEKASIPVPTACYSGFPTSHNKVYAGMHPSQGFYWDERLIYASWDRGDTWTNVTGDLYSEAARLYPGIRGGHGPSGIVTIAPRYSK
ncbi:MAG: hypothetical protein GWN93_05830 [Deltaproteobacteria bacterium]|nr:hypothetical protein [Deltaproteobacteria bacterium]